MHINPLTPDPPSTSWKCVIFCRSYRFGKIKKSCKNELKILRTFRDIASTKNGGPVSCTAVGAASRGPPRRRHVRLRPAAPPSLPPRPAPRADDRFMMPRRERNMNSCGEGRVPHLLPSTNNHEHIYPKLWISAYHLLVTRDWIRATFTYDTLIPNESDITYRIAIIVREREIHVFYRQRILSKEMQRHWGGATSVGGTTRSTSGRWPRHTSHTVLLTAVCSSPADTGDGH